CERRALHSLGESHDDKVILLTQTVTHILSVQLMFLGLTTLTEYLSIKSISQTASINSIMILNIFLPITVINFPLSKS
ncbi:hypothetical protein L2734_10135, partial [Parashewanella spongiae]|uniref:hypothetical protein n=1 Tax=Parashewanella spongiae TaxID=342950 RepID=UPI00200E1E4E